MWLQKQRGYRATTILVAAGLAMAELLPQPSSAAVYYPWRAQYYDAGSTIERNFLTRDQRRTSLGGIGGYCSENPKPPSACQGSAVPPPPARQRRPAR